MPTAIPAYRDIWEAESDLDSARYVEAFEIASQTWPTNAHLGTAYDDVVKALESGGSLEPVLENYLEQEESAKGPDGNPPPEAELVRDGQVDRLMALVRYTQDMKDLGKADDVDLRKAQAELAQAEKLPVDDNIQLGWPPAA